MKKVLSLLLVFAVLLGVMLVAVSCGTTTDPGTKPDETKPTESDTAPGKTETGAETEDPRIKPDIPETYDFHGEVYRVGGWSIPGWDEMARGIRDVVSEGYNADVVNDAVYERNTAIQDNYQIVIEFDHVPYVEFRDKLIRDAQVGDAEWNVVYPLMNTFGGLVLNNALSNIRYAPHVDLSKPWYDQSCLDYLAVSDAVFAVSTAASINDKDGTAALAFNKVAAQDNDLPDLYEITSKGDWTIEILDQCCRGVLADLNGDQVFDEHDFYGFLGKHDVAPSFKDGFESMIITKDSDGMYEFTLGSEYDIEVSEVILEFMSEDYFFNQHLYGMSDPDFTQKFGAGEGLFFWMRMDEVTNLRAAETDFGILPIPKYDEHQTRYYDLVMPDGDSILAVPISNDAPEVTGFVLEALTAESYYTVYPAFFDVVMMGKCTRDPESRDMLGIIFNSRTYDTGLVQGLGGFMNEYVLYAQMHHGDVAFTSLYKTYESKIGDSLEKINQLIDNWNAE